MRVIAGTVRGLRLEAPQGSHTRPTADRVREALFSILQSRRDLTGLEILDLCAGTGALGIEALSRGASSCCFIEQDRRAAACLRRNLSKARFSERATIAELDVLRGVRQLAQGARRFDLVFFDPPYASGLYDIVPGLLADLSLLAPDGLLVAEASSRVPLPERLGGLVKIDRRVYGETAIELYELEST